MTLAADVLVAGDGIAGCAAAIALAKSGVEVVVISQPRGASAELPETLAPAAVPLLRELGVNTRDLDEAFPRLTTRFSRWGVGPAECQNMLPRVSASLLLGKSVLRSLLTDILRQYHCTIIKTDRIRDLSVSQEGVALRLRPMGGSSLQLVRGRMIIDATGRPCTIAHDLGVRRTTYDSLVSFWICGESGDCLQHATVTATVQDGWVFYIGASAGRGTIGFFTAGSHVRKKPTASSIVERVQGISELAGIVSKFPGWTSCPVTTRNATTSRLQSTCGPGWMACGDALQTVDPIASSGNLLALRQGIQSAEVTKAWLLNDPGPLQYYCSEAHRSFESILKYRRHFYGLA